MPDVFISYSRKDTDFVRRLFESLQRANRNSWVDWEGIPYSVDWWQEICRGIDASDVFLFIVSPDSVASEICNQEIAYARQNNKRFIPIVYREVEEASVAPLWQGQSWEATARDNWNAIKHLNWLFFRPNDDFNLAYQNLLRTIDQDPDHVRQHTRLLVRAREWQQNASNPSFLLRGTELAEAEQWLMHSTNQAPFPVALHTNYILTSRAKERQNQRVILSGVSVALVLTIGLAILAFVLYLDANKQRQLAEDNYQLARSEALTAYSIANSPILREDVDDLELAILLAVEANKTQKTSPNARTQLALLLFGRDDLNNPQVENLSGEELVKLAESRLVLRDFEPDECDRFRLNLCD